MKQTILIFGQGQLGSAYRQWYEQAGQTVISPKLDIRNKDSISEAIATAKPDLIINAVAKTSIDWCDQNRLEALAVNTLGADYVAEAAEAAGVKLVHISSGCIQESVSELDIKSETDEPHPVCFYSWTKVWAENLLTERARRGSLRVVILRPRQLLSSVVSPRNALVKLLTYKKFIDRPQSCTIVEDLMSVTNQLVEQDVSGIFNVVNEGVISPWQIAQLLKEVIDPELSLEQITKADLNEMTLAKRIDAVLSTDKLKSLSITLPQIAPRLREILADLKLNLDSPAGREVMEITRQETLKKLSLK